MEREQDAQPELELKSYKKGVRFVRLDMNYCNRRKGVQGEETLDFEVVK